jgi:hypothetical protein
MQLNAWNLLEVPHWSQIRSKKSIFAKEELHRQPPQRASALDHVYMCKRGYDEKRDP